MKSSSQPENSKEMLINKKYKEIISKVEVFHCSPYAQYQGFWFRLNFLEGMLRVQEIFKAQPSHIFICSSVKTGTTWLKSLAFSIITRHVYDDDTNPLLTKVSHECVPNLEHDFATNPNFLGTHELPLLSTHLPYSILPKSITESDCKIVYICREPKDTLVSFWYHSQKLYENSDNLKAKSVTFEQVFESFCEGKSFNGPYWDHVSEYRKASKDKPHRVFFLTYEDLKNDTSCYVKKLAEFMGKPFSKEEEIQGVAEKIVARCSFQSLSNLNVNKSMDKSMKFNNAIYFRKGEIGDWKNHMNEAMAKSIDHITQEKFRNLDLPYPI